MATIAQNLASLQQARTDIAEAIENKGVTLEEGAGFTDFPQAIEDIPSGVDTSNDTVTSETLAEGVTAHDASGAQITGNLKSSSWLKLQEKVRANNLDDINNDDIYACKRNNDALLWRVIDKNHDEPANLDFNNSLTLLLASPFFIGYNSYKHLKAEDKSNIYANFLSFDFPEAFYYCDEELPADYYSYMEGTILRYFRTKVTIPKGGKIWYSYTSSSSASLLIYDDDNNIIENAGEVHYRSQSGITYTFLGTTGDEVDGSLNKNSTLCGYQHRIYKNSIIRQWLNSDKPKGEWFTPMNKFCVPPPYAFTTDGFMHGMDEDFLSSIGKTKIITVDPDDLENPYITEDYFFLPSVANFTEKNSKYQLEGGLYSGAKYYDIYRYNCVGLCSSSTSSGSNYFTIRHNGILRSPVIGNSTKINFLKHDSSSSSISVGELNNLGMYYGTYCMDFANGNTLVTPLICCNVI